MALPNTGRLSIKDAAGSTRSIAREVDTTGNKSLSTLSASAGKGPPHSMLEFRGYSSSTGAPNAPTNATASTGIPGTASVSWSHSGLGQPVKHFRLERTAAGNPRVWVFIINATSLSYADSGLASDQGSGIYSGKTDHTLYFKSLNAGSNITLTNSASGITIASTGGGGMGLSGTQTVSGISGPYTWLEATGCISPLIDWTRI